MPGGFSSSRLVLLFGSLAIPVENLCSGPMTLRRRVAPVLPFGWPADPGQRRALALDVWLCVAVFGRFCFYRQSGGRDQVNNLGFRSMTLRRRVFPVWLFIGALSLSRKWNSISIQQAFYY
jgi:hypothetical protein